jgi:hypothetical protein
MRLKYEPKLSLYRGKGYYSLNKIPVTSPSQSGDCATKTLDKVVYTKRRKNVVS